MSDLHSQLREYVESTIERVDMEDVVAAVAAGQATDPRPVFRRRPAWVAAGAALLVVLLIGVPLVLFRGGESTIVDQATTTTVAATSTMASTTQPVPETTVPPETVAPLPGVPLDEAVPGFTDTIVMFTTPTFHKVYRWNPSDPTPEVILTASGNPVGLDLSGSWLAEIGEFGDLMVYPVPMTVGDSSEPVIGASDVVSALWHDSDPGRMAVLTCAEPSSETATLSTLDIMSGDAEPVFIRSFPLGCEVGDTFLEGWEFGDAYLNRWNSEGVTVNVFNGDIFEPILINLNGSETPIDPGITVLPPGPDGQVFDVKEVVGDDEAVGDALWSPDGTLIALKMGVPSSDVPNRSVRLVDPLSGMTVAEIPERDGDGFVTAMKWSSNGRFLLYAVWDQPAELGDDSDDSATLGFYDTDTNTTTLMPLPEVIDEIRIP